MIELPTTSWLRHSNPRPVSQPKHFQLDRERNFLIVSFPGRSLDDHPREKPIYTAIPDKSLTVIDGNISPFQPSWRLLAPSQTPLWSPLLFCANPRCLRRAGNLEGDQGGLCGLHEMIPSCRNPPMCATERRGGRGDPNGHPGSACGPGPREGGGTAADRRRPTVTRPDALALDFFSSEGQCYLHTRTSVGRTACFAAE